MYYLVYGILYLISLLPFFILYLISDFIVFILFNVIGYRKEVVLGNLAIAFPEKSLEERKKIAKEFYRNLTDTMVETIKLLSISNKELIKRSDGDFSIINKYIDAGRNVQLHAGHQMNWEYGVWTLSRHARIPFLGVYMELGNAVFERLMRKIRGQANIILVPKHQFANRTHAAFSSQYAIALVADQNPSFPEKAYWLNFFSKAAPFVTGPDKGAQKFDPAVFFARFVKVKRGHYRFEIELVTEHPAALEPGELTRKYRDLLEKTIEADPSNYLWSHRRWKHTYKDAYQQAWIDDAPPKV